MSSDTLRKVYSYIEDADAIMLEVRCLITDRYTFRCVPRVEVYAANGDVLDFMERECREDIGFEESRKEIEAGL